MTFPIGLKLYFSQNKFCKISLSFNKLTRTLNEFFLTSILFDFNKDNYPDPQKYLVGIYTANQNLIPMEEMKFDDDFDINNLINELEEGNN